VWDSFLLAPVKAIIVEKAGLDSTMIAAHPDGQDIATLKFRTS
jgi:hypothetical protein